MEIRFKRFHHPLFFLFYTVILIQAGWGVGCKSNTEVPEQVNILFIGVDDLRPEINTYGAHHMHTPQLDKLAEAGMVFTRAYCNIPVCGASRASIFSGLRPTRYRFLSYLTRVDEDASEVTPLHTWFRKAGYYTISNGKILHHQHDAADGWDEIWRPQGAGSWRNYLDPANIAQDTGKQRGPAWERIEVADSAYFDGKIANKTITDLKRLGKKKQPFFLACGFLKPHLPFNAPAKYWELYDRKNITLPKTYRPDASIPSQALHNSGELRNYSDIPNGVLSDSLAITLIHGYYACVSYTDAQIGRVLAALEQEGLRDQTLVMLWGDHGWNLGEHGLWCKHCNFETSLHVPLMVSGPGIDAGRNNALVEYVDLYPTLCDLAGIRAPAHLQGESLKTLVLNNGNPTDSGPVVAKWHEGTTLIDDRYFYTEWSDENDSVYAHMLFDHHVDPGETENLAEDDRHEHLIPHLHQQLIRYRGPFFNRPSPATDREE